MVHNVHHSIPSLKNICKVNKSKKCLVRCSWVMGCWFVMPRKLMFGKKASGQDKPFHLNPVLLSTPSLKP